MDTTISWMIGSPRHDDLNAERRMAHVRALREARGPRPSVAGRFAAAIAGLRGGTTPEPGGQFASLDAVCCTA
jgi:hypothetical protein